MNRWKRWIASAAVALVAMGAPPASAVAQDEPEVQRRADAVTVLDGQFEIPRPTGWTIVAPEEGAVAVFRSETDARAQIEVRLSDAVPEGRWERFWRAFDTDLQEAGFSLVLPRQRRSYAGQRGFLFEYELERDDRAYRLLVWHTHESNRAWVYSAFFREERRDAYLETFEELLRAMEW